jgi:acetylornithine/N-succinyldiaminopimelate aminotransferase
MTTIPDSLFPNYARSPLAFERGEGVWLISQDNDRYLDFMAGIAVNLLGHCHPHLVEALQDQAAKLWHVSNVFRIPEGERLAQRLCAASFADNVLFCNSGAEAMEAAIKTARRFHYLEGRAERNVILTFSGAFHGRTLATIAAGGQAAYLEGFEPRMPGFVSLPFGDHEALKEAIKRPDIAAVLVEPVQGEGGIHAVPDVCLQGLRALCDELGVLLIFDEIQCGMGRTGTLFAHQTSGIEPDIMAVAKGIGGGFPLGACLAKGAIAKALGPGTHGTTYGGNPLAMRVGNAVLDIVLEPSFVPHVKKMGVFLHDGLTRLVDDYPDLLQEVRGRGLMLGLKCRIENKALVSAARDQHLLLVGADDNVVRLLPPLIITEKECEEALARLRKACEAIQATALKDKEAVL